MTTQKDADLKNLPDNFRIIFTNVNRQIREFGESISLANYSFVVTQMVFLADFDDKEKNLSAEQFRKMLFEAMNNNRQDSFNEKVNLIERKQNEYIQSLYAQGLVFLWARLESLIKQLIAALIAYDNKLLAAESFKSIKIPMSKYFGIADNEKTNLLTDLIVDNLCDSKYGFYKLECYLSAIGLSGSFNDEHKKNIITLHQFRNCIVHNDSIVDAKLHTECQWLSYKVGDKIIVTDKDFRSFEFSVLAYIQEVFFRLNKAFGAPEHYLDTLRKMLDGLFNDSNSSTIK